jgi:hypothetical protein
VNPTVEWLLREIGVQVWKTRSEQVTPEPMQEAARVITFGCVDECPAGATGKHKGWPIPGSSGSPTIKCANIRDDLRRRIADLVQRLPGANAPATKQN